MTNRFKSASQLRAGTKTAAIPDSRRRPLDDTRAAPRDIRRPLDDYETPENATLALCEFVDLGFCPRILERAAGSGRMVRALQKGYPGANITAADIKQGDDFLQRDDSAFLGHIITNPGKLADPFIAKALQIADGKVAMLMQSGFLFGGKRALALYARHKPELLILIPWRIMFIEGDGSERPINSQTYTHVCTVWPEREQRDSNTETRVEWASQQQVQSWQ